MSRPRSFDLEDGALNSSLLPNCYLNIFLLLGIIDDASATKFVICWYQAVENTSSRGCIHSNMDSCFLFVRYILCLYSHSPYSCCQEIALWVSRNVLVSKTSGCCRFTLDATTSRTCSRRNLPHISRLYPVHMATSMLSGRGLSDFP